MDRNTSTTNQPLYSTLFDTIYLRENINHKNINKATNIAYQITKTTKPKSHITYNVYGKIFVWIEIINSTYIPSNDNSTTV